MRGEYQSVKGEDATHGFACRFSVNPAVARGGDLGVGRDGNWIKCGISPPLDNFWRGLKSSPSFSSVQNFDPLPPSTCYNVYNAESCSTGITSIHRCSTGFGGRQSVINPLVGGCNTTSGGGHDPRVRVGEFFLESGSGFPDIFSDISSDTYSDNPVEFDGIRPVYVNHLESPDSSHKHCVPAQHPLNCV